MTGMLCSMERYEQLSDGVRGRMQAIREDEQALGESEKFVFDKAFAEKHGIRELGRVTSTIEGLELHAAPQYIDEESMFTSDPPDFFDFMSSFVRNEEAVLNLDAACDPVEYPKSTFTDLENHTAKVEEFLFKRLAISSGTFSVLNPSPSTIRRTKPYTVVYVVSSEEARTWTDDYLSKQNIVSRSVLIDDSVGPLYMGSNGASTWYSNSLALVPNPYSPIPMYDNLNVQEVWNGVKMSYWKRDHEVNARLDDRSGHYLYPPHCIPGSGGTYFIESSFPLGLVPTPDVYSAPHSPFFLTELPPYQLEGSMMVSKKNGLYYDVVGEGTYMSRRFFYTQFEWAPFVPVGSVPIDRYTLEPKVKPGIRYAEHEGASVVTYSKHRDVELVGPYSSIKYGPTVFVSLDARVTNQSLYSDIVQRGFHIDQVDSIEIHPYERGHCYRLTFRDSISSTEFLESGSGAYKMFTLRIEKHLIQYKDVLYATHHMKRGLVFVPRSDGKSVIAGFPPGSAHRSWTMLVDGVSRIFLPCLKYGKLPDKPWLAPCAPLREFQQRKVAVVFASMWDFHYYFGTAVLNTASWVSHSIVMTEYPDAKTPEPRLTLLDQISDVVDGLIIKDWSDPGASTAYVASRIDDAGITPQKLRQTFFPNVRVVVWRMGQSLSTTEWASLRSINITFPGVPKNPLSVNGKGIGEVYGYVRTTRVGVLEFDGILAQIAPFIRLLESNRIYVEYRFYLGGVRLYFTMVS